MEPGLQMLIASIDAYFADRSRPASQTLAGLREAQQHIAILADTLAPDPFDGGDAEGEEWDSHAPGQVDHLGEV